MKSKRKTQNSRILAMYIITILFVICMPIRARATEQTVNDVKNSIVQVVLVYQEKDGEKYILQSTSGFVVSNQTIITNQKTLTLTDEAKKKAEKYLNKKIGTGKEEEGKKKKISLQGDNSSGSIYIAIIKKGDVFIKATIVNESKEMNFAILKTEETIGWTNATLGDSTQITSGQEIYAVGYPDTNPFAGDGAQKFDVTDAVVTFGSVSQSADIIMHNAKLSAGSTGGPLTDALGNVIGLNIYLQTDEEAGAYRALSINEIKYFLESANIAYTSAVQTEEIQKNENEADENEETPIQESNPERSDYKALEEAIIYANIFTKNDNQDKKYTTDSFMELKLALANAMTVSNNEQATKEEIDVATLALHAAMDALEENNAMGWILVIVMIFFILLIAFVVFLLLKKGVFQSKSQGLVVYRENNARMGGYGEFAATTENASNQSNSQYQTGNSGAGETSILNAGSSNATTLLGAGKGNIIKGYLIRKRTTERIVIDSAEFTLGKDYSIVNYCIQDAEAISRRHAKIIRKGMDYYLIDLQSTNYTYLNDDRVMPGEDRKLKPNDLIKLADEEFEFTLA